MCLDRLYLVQPKHFPSAEATARASGADDVLAKAVVCDSLEEALAGCRFVVGTTARSRRLSLPIENPRQSAVRLVDEGQQGEVALVFGREDSGLSNDELEKCHYLVHIPTNPDYSSLNLAAAVQVLVYELMMVEPEERTQMREEPRDVVTAEEMESFYGHLEETLTELRFLDSSHPKKLMRRLRRLYDRARPDKTEMNILRGMLSAAQRRKPR